jgi:hypothetical protein
MAYTVTITDNNKFNERNFVDYDEKYYEITTKAIMGGNNEPDITSYDSSFTSLDTVEVSTNTITDSIRENLKIESDNILENFWLMWNDSGVQTHFRDSNNDERFPNQYKDILEENRGKHSYKIIKLLLGGDKDLGFYAKLIMSNVDLKKKTMEIKYEE